LSAIGHQVVFRLSGWSRRIHSEFQGFAATWGHVPRRHRVFAYGGITHCAGPSQVLRLTTTLSYSSLGRQSQPNGPTTPGTQRLPAITRTRFGLFRFRSPLLTESRLLSLPVGTEMFHFPTFPPHTLCVQVWVTGHDSCRVSPFGNPWIKARLAAPQGFSQPPTSFFGSWCQGIHRAPLLTWPQRFRCSRPLCSSQGTGDTWEDSPRAQLPRQPSRSALTRSNHWTPAPHRSAPPAPRGYGVVARSLRTQQRAYGRNRLPARRFGACWAGTYWPRGRPVDRTD
jgi:hypothetical protein